MRTTSYHVRLCFGALDLGKRHGEEWRKVVLECFPNLYFGNVIVLVPIEVAYTHDILPRDRWIVIAHVWFDPAQASAGF